MSVRPVRSRSALQHVSATIAVLVVATTAAHAAPAGETPRAAVTQFLEAARRNDDTTAAAFLELDGIDASRGPILARRLKAVLDRHAWIRPDRLSNAAEGARDDGLLPDVEQIAVVPGAGGVEQPIRLHRSSDGAWRFSADTVAGIDTWYEALGGRWFLEHLPGWMLRPGPYELLVWQWVVLPILVVLAWMLGIVLGRFTRAVLHRVVRHTQSDWDDKLLERLTGPFRWLWAIVLLRLAIPLLGLYMPAETAVGGLLRAILFLVFFWAVLRLIDTGAQGVMSSRWAQQFSASRSLVPLGVRMAKVVILVIAVISLLSQFGYPVASLIAGLGIGGIALALAAQKTVENLFGAFSIGVDQPFREGDYVRIDDFSGTVEAIGLRSTRIRTADRTIITMPNGRVADARIESFAARDRIRLQTTLGVVYDTTAAQLRQILAGFERVLRAHPKLWPDAVTVRFLGFGDHALNIEVQAWFQTSEFDEFRVCREEVLLGFMDVVEAAGSSFAFPTHTVHIVGDPKRTRDPALRRTAPAGRGPGDDDDGEEDAPLGRGDGPARADGDDPDPEAPPDPEAAP